MLKPILNKINTGFMGYYAISSEQLPPQLGGQVCLYSDHMSARDLALTVTRASGLPCSVSRIELLGGQRVNDCVVVYGSLAELEAGGIYPTFSDTVSPNSSAARR